MLEDGHRLHFTAYKLAEPRAKARLALSLPHNLLILFCQVFNKPFLLADPAILVPP